MNFEPLIPPYDEKREAEGRILQLYRDLCEDGGDEVIVGGLFGATVRYTPSPALCAAIARASILDPVCPADTDSGWAVALYDLVGAPMGTFTCVWDVGYVFTPGAVEVTS